MEITQFRSHFYSGDRYLHFNNSGMGLIPDVYRDEAGRWLQCLYEQGAHCGMDLWGVSEAVRAKLAKFIGAAVSEVAFFQTTASALSQAANAVPLAAGDEVLTWDQEYPSNFYPWRQATEKCGARLVQVASPDWQTPYQALLDRVTPRTRAIAVSWVQYQTGSVTDLKALAGALQGSGIWLIADVIQGAGVRPLNFADTGFDIICGGSHKFLCSGFGAAYMAVRQERLAAMTPLETGAMTYGDPDTVKSFAAVPKADASKFEPGTKSVVEIAGLGKTLDLFQQAGRENIWNEACRLAARLREGLSDRELKIHSPDGHIVTFAPPDLDRTAQALTAAGVSYAKRGPGIRLSTHAYNTDAQVDRVLSLI